MRLAARLKIEEHGTPRYAVRRRNLFQEAMSWRFSTGCGYPPLGAKPRTAWTLFGHQSRVESLREGTGGGPTKGGSRARIQERMREPYGTVGSTPTTSHPNVLPADTQRADERRMEHLRATLVCLDAQTCNDPLASRDSQEVGAN